MVPHILLILSTIFCQSVISNLLYSLILFVSLITLCYKILKYGNRDLHIINNQGISPIKLITVSLLNDYIGCLVSAIACYSNRQIPNIETFHPEILKILNHIVRNCKNADVGNLMYGIFRNMEFFYSAPGGNLFKG